MQGVAILHPVGCERALVFQLLACKEEALLVGVTCACHVHDMHMHMHMCMCMHMYMCMCMYDATPPLDSIIIHILGLSLTRHYAGQPV